MEKAQQIDYGSLIAAAVVYAIIQFAPQIQALVGNDPVLSVVVGIVLLIVSQVGSNIAKKQVSEQSYQEGFNSGLEQLQNQ